jgi:HEAT repeat protein
MVSFRSRHRRGRARAVIGLLLVSGIVAGSVAHASAQNRSMERIVQALSSYERLPPRAYWRKLGPETVQHLEALYRDPERPTFIRLRAVRVASFYSTPRARTFLLAVARNPDEKELLVREAILGLAEAFGKQIADELVVFLEHDRALVRKAASTALSTIATDDCRRALRRRLNQESDPAVRVAIEQALAK